MSLGITLLRSIVDARQLGAAIGWNTLTVGLSSAAGPTLGALVLSVGSWRWLFAINLPLGLLVLLATCALPAVPGSQRKLDGSSITLNATAFGLLVIGAELAPYRGVLAMGLLIVAALVLVALVRRELPKQIPMVPLDLLREASFRVSVIASVCFFVGQSAAMVSMPFHFQHVLGLDNMTTGLTITSWPLSVAVVAPLAGHLVNRVSGAWLCVLGGALLASGLTFVAFCTSGGTPLMLAMAACGVGFGLFQVSNNRNMLLSAEPSRSSAAGGMQATARLTGQTVGALVVMLIFNLAPVELAPRLGLAIASGLTMAAGLLSILRSAGL
jgi:MFS transporter, DHA2 family, multidrug resistance protein